MFNSEILLLFLVFYHIKGQTLYKLYQEPKSIGNIALFSEASNDVKRTIFLSENYNQIIIAQKKLTFNFIKLYQFASGSLQYILGSSDIISFDSIKAFWIFNQYILFVGPSRMQFYRPQLNGRDKKAINITENGTNLLANVKNKDNRTYLTIIQERNQSWVMKKYQLINNSSNFTKFVRQKIFTKSNLREDPYQIIITNNFDCFSVASNDNYEYRMFCVSFQTQITYNFSICSQSYDLKFYGDPTTDDFYSIIGGYYQQIYKFSLSQNGSQVKKQLFFQSTNIYTIQQLIVSSREIIMLATLNKKSDYYLIIFQKYEEKFYITQYISFDTQFLNIQYMSKINNSILLMGVQKKMYQNVPANVALISYINYSTNFYLLYAIIFSYSIFTLFLTIKSLIGFQIYKKLFNLQRRCITLAIQIMIISLIHVILFLQAISTDTSNNSKLNIDMSRSVYQQPFQLKIYELLFVFTALISVIFETSNEHRAKAQYLNFLMKHGLKASDYFYYRQHSIIMKFFIYAAMSLGVLYQLESRFCQSRVRLYPTFEQLLAVSFSYCICLFVLHNAAFLFAYMCRSYLLLMESLLSICFIIFFMSNELYLNKFFTLQERIMICINPITLFYSLVQYIFKTQIRFNGNITSTFLFSILIMQTILIFVAFKLYYVKYFKSKSLGQIINCRKDSYIGAINQSAQGESFEIFNEANLNEQPLLKVYIPCKLNNNDGFQKANILKDIRFSGRRGEIITFLDCDNVSKAMLFEILVNNEKSDSHIEKDLSGQISYTQMIKLSYCLDQVAIFKQLSILQRLELISTLRNPSASKIQRSKEIEFILNQFNVPDQFRTMKSTQLSGGYLKKVSLACAFIGNPDVVIIDEPALGLDIRFKCILYRKLRQWKKDKLIILGTSDQLEEEEISDKIWALQRGKAIDRSNMKAKKLITRLKLQFQEFDDFLKAQKIMLAHFNSNNIVREHECNQNKGDYKISLALFNNSISCQIQLQRIMQELNEEFNFCTNICYMNFRIIEHPFDQSSFQPFKASLDSSLKDLTLSDLSQYMTNKVLEINSDDQMYDHSEDLHSKAKKRSSKLLKQLNQLEKGQSSYYSQFKAIFDRQNSIWKGNKLKQEFLIVSLYSWTQNIVWFKINRPLENYDFINALIIYCFLHLSVIELRVRQYQSLRYSFLIGANGKIALMATCMFDFSYMFLGFCLNLSVQTILIDAILLGKLQFYILEKTVCSFFFIINFTLFSSILARSIKKVSVIIAFLAMTHIVFVQNLYNSFVQSYQNTSYFYALKYGYYPITIMNLFDSLIKKQNHWILFISIFIQIVVFMVGIYVFFQNFTHKKKKNRFLQEYKNIHNDPINSQRVFIQNVEDKGLNPLICDNIIHFYAKQAVLKNFYLHVGTGQVFGLLGHNGCGKTTALKIIAGEANQASGDAFIFGKDTGRTSPHHRHQIGYCPQFGLLEQEMTVEQNIRFIGSLKGLTTSHVTKFMIKMFRYFRLKGIEQVKVKYLSDSERKKVNLIISFLGFPKILILDEITSGIDSQGRRKALNLIKSYSEEYGASVLFASHNISEAEQFCDRVCVLKQGILKKVGSPSNLKSQQQHQFYLLAVNFKHELVIVRDKKKAKVREYILSLTFVKLERDQNYAFAFSLDIRRISIIEVWKKVYIDFFLGGIVQKFSLGRHGLLQIVKYSITEQQNMNQWQYKSKVQDDNKLFYS